MNKPNGSVIKKAISMLQERFQTQWKKRLFNDIRRNGREGNKLRTFRKFKCIFKPEPYINIIPNFEERSNLCKFRTSAHMLNIELGRQ